MAHIQQLKTNLMLACKTKDEYYTLIMTQHNNTNRIHKLRQQVRNTQTNVHCVHNDMKSSVHVEYEQAKHKLRHAAQDTAAPREEPLSPRCFHLRQQEE